MYSQFIKSFFLLLAFALGYANLTFAQGKPPVANPHVEDTSNVYIAVEKMPEYPGGENAMFNYLSSQFVYPETLKKDSITGTAVATFIVGINGKVHEVQILRKVHPLIDAELVRVLQSMPHWVPGQQNGRVIRVKYAIPYRIVSSNVQKPAVKNEEGKIYAATEVPPAFPGGQKALERFLRKNYTAPSHVAIKNPYKVVVISTILNKDGSIRTTETKLLKGVAAAVDDRLIQLINSLPSFAPASQNNQPVAHIQVFAIKIDESGHFVRLEQGHTVPAGNLKQ
ncbi:energy transducer TonB [Nibribacter koreensis]